MINKYLNSGKIPFLLLSVLIIFSCVSLDKKTTQMENQNNSTDIKTSAGIFFTKLISEEKPVRLLMYSIGHRLHLSKDILYSFNSFL